MAGQTLTDCEKRVVKHAKSERVEGTEKNEPSWLTALMHGVCWKVCCRATKAKGRGIARSHPKVKTGVGILRAGSKESKGPARPHGHARGGDRYARKRSVPKRPRTWAKKSRSQTRKAKTQHKAGEEQVKGICTSGLASNRGEDRAAPGIRKPETGVFQLCEHRHGNVTWRAANRRTPSETAGNRKDRGLLPTKEKEDIRIKTAINKIRNLKLNHGETAEKKEDRSRTENGGGEVKDCPKKT